MLLLRLLLLLILLFHIIIIYYLIIAMVVRRPFRTRLTRAASKGDSLEPIASYVERELGTYWMHVALTSENYTGIFSDSTWSRGGLVCEWTDDASEIVRGGDAWRNVDVLMPTSISRQVLTQLCLELHTKRGWSVARLTRLMRQLYDEEQQGRSAMALLNQLKQS